jgi:hypothetical protein
MKTRSIACALVMATLAVAWPVDAGAIYGSIFFNGAGLKGGAITITCGGDSVKGATLDDGSYRLPRRKDAARSAWPAPLSARRAPR